MTRSTALEPGRSKDSSESCLIYLRYSIVLVVRPHLYGYMRKIRSLAYQLHGCYGQVRREFDP